MKKKMEKKTLSNKVVLDGFSFFVNNFSRNQHILKLDLLSLYEKASKPFGNA